MAKKSKRKIVYPEDVLEKGWPGFNRGLSKLSEDSLKKALELELAGKNRPSYIERIHNRYNTIRVEREKRELAEKVAEGV